jgi:outer membrane protein OmpA-like peptidoglycan-associated protein
MTNLLSLIQSAIQPSLTQGISGYLGESESSTKSALAAAIAAVLAAIARLGSSPSGADQLLATLRSPDIDPGFATSLPVALGGPTTDTLIRQGTSLTSSLLGDRQGALANALSSSSGLKSSSVSKLLALVVPLVLGLLKKYVAENRLNAGGLSKLLGGQTDFLKGSLDGRLAGALGLPDVGAAAADVGARATGTARAARDEAVRAADTGKSMIGRLAPWLVAAVILLALFSIFRSKQAREPVQTAAQATADAASSAAEAVKARMKSLTLPGGITIDAPEGGFIESFAAILADPNASIDKGIAFDAVTFETSSATLTATSRDQLEQLGRVLAAYPTVKIRVDGYTDASGDPAANLKLSQERAAAVVAALVGEGIGSDRIEAKGFGQERPVASNDTEEGRAQNRRVEVVVVER